MTIRASFVRAGAVALPLGLAATAGHAANLVDVAGGMEQLSTFNDAIAAAGLEEKLAGEGPFTVFAPSNQAFEQLPQPLLSKLLEEAHQAELTRLLEHHVIDGKAVSAKDVVGRETEVETAAGDQLTVDGTGSIVLVIPTGMTVARAGDQVMVERRAAVAVAPSVEVGAGEEAAESTEVAEDSDMPATEHQQEVLASDTEVDTRQTAPEGEMPATQHQEEVLASDAETDTGQAAESGMPATQHQEEVLASQPEGDSGQAGTAARCCVRGVSSRPISRPTMA